MVTVGVSFLTTSKACRIAKKTRFLRHKLSNESRKIHICFFQPSSPNISEIKELGGKVLHFFLYETFAQMFSLILYFLKGIYCQEANNNIKPVQRTPLSVEHCVSDCLFLVSCIKLMTFAASLVITQRYLK